MGSTDRETIILIYQALGRSVIDYAAPIWAPVINDTTWKYLQTSQNEALRIATSFSSGACLRRRSCFYEFPPSRLILSTSLRSRQSKIHRLQVGLHGSEPGLPWMTNPPSPVVRWARNAGLESSVMILSRVSSVEISNRLP